MGSTVHPDVLVASRPPGPGVTPEVCVVVPAYNAAAYLPHALDSLLEQTFPAWDCVIVDDGSTDDTAAVAREYVERDDRFRLIEQGNGGSSRARNAGVEVADPGTPYLAFLDADDAWLPDALAVLVTRLEAAPAAVGVYGLAEYMDGSGEPVLPGLHPMRQRDRRRMGRVDLTGLAPDQPYTFESLVISGTLWPSSVALHRRVTFDEVGGFDPVMRQLQDWELYLRMSRRGPFLPVDRQVAWYRQHDANITKRTHGVAYHTALVRWKVWRSPANTAGQRRLTRRVWRRLTTRWLGRSVIAELQAWRRHDLALARCALTAVRAFLGELLRGHPAAPGRRGVRLLEMFVTGVDREGGRDRAAATGSGARR